MKGPVKERWLELTEQAADEQDPEKFMLLIKEINSLLEAKEQALRVRRATRSTSDQSTQN
ncbi:MAG TPA: hypothetical protein VN684_09455 [Terriglobales bacterium]|nr:hypothetical protein [Terriglobales bacterium]